MVTALSVPFLLAQQPGIAGSIPPQGTQAPQTGAIFGQVLDAGSGEPIAEAIVTLVGRGAPPPGGRGTMPSSFGAQPGQQRVFTDAQGRFVFHDLGRGPFNLNASASGYFSDNLPPVGRGGQAALVRLEDGQHLAGYRIPLSKYAVVSGTVLDEAGEPAVGVMVSLIQRSTSNGGAELGFGSAGRTDDRGQYRISGLRPGDYLAAVPEMAETMPTSMVDTLMEGFAAAMPNGGAMRELLESELQSGGPGSAALRVGDLIVSMTSNAPPTFGPDGRILAYQSTYYPNASSSALASLITLKSGEVRNGVDFQLRLIPTVRVSGTVTGPTGPVANTEVHLVPGRTMPGISNDVASTRTMADGTFTFLAVPEGDYFVKVVKEPAGDIPEEFKSSPLMSLVMGDTTNKVLLFAQSALSIASADVTGVSLTLREGLTVSGRFRFDGAQEAPAGSTLESWQVRLTAMSGGTLAQPTKVSADGQFRTERVVPGRYFINVLPGGANPNASGAAGATGVGGNRAIGAGQTARAGGPGGATGALPWTLKSVLVNGRDQSLEGIDLTDGDVGDIVLVVTDKTGAIAGAVRDADHRAPARASVVMIPGDYRAWIAAGQRTERMRQTNMQPNGNYNMALVLAGEYLIAAVDPVDLAGRQDAAFFDAFARVATRVTLGESERKTLDLQVVKVQR